MFRNVRHQELFENLLYNYLATKVSGETSPNDRNI
jgi:hypothetical protein